MHDVAETSSSRSIGTRSERGMTLLLRVMAGVEFLALLAVFMPHAWMDYCHNAMELGTLPRMPIVVYLTRSVSLLYVLQAGMLLLLSRDVRRYRDLVVYFALALVAFGGVSLWIDLTAGLPWYWVVAEGPMLIVLGLVALGLLRGVRRENAA